MRVFQVANIVAAMAESEPEVLVGAEVDWDDDDSEFDVDDFWV